MGSNPVQAQGVLAFVVAFVFLAAAIAAGGNLILFLVAVASFGVSGVLFLKCKPWEHREE